MDSRDRHEDDILDRATRALRETPVPEEEDAQETDRLLAACLTAVRELKPSDDFRPPQDSSQPTTRPDAHVPTELADGVSRETRPIEQPPARRHVVRRFVAMFHSNRVRWSIVAAAAAVALVVLGLWPQGSGRHKGAGVAFGDVVQRVNQAATVTYRTLQTQGDMPAVISRVTVLISGKLARIEVLAAGGETDAVAETVTSISVYNDGRMLNMDPRTMKAVLFDYVDDGLPHQLSESHTLADLLNLDAADAESLGEQAIDGRATVGFRVNRDSDEFTRRSVVVWADAQTLLPVRVEETRTERRPDEKALKALQRKASEQGVVRLSPEEADEVRATWPEVTTTQTVTDIVFDVPVDDSMFSLDPPEGYTLSVTKVPG